MNAKFQVHTNSGSWDMGEKGSKLGDFGHFSKDIVMIWFVLLEMEDIIVLHMHAKFQVKWNFCSRDIGQKWVNILGFWEFLQNYRYDLVRFLRERRYYSITFARKVSTRDKYSFSRYGGNSGLKWGLSGFSQKV